MAGVNKEIWVAQLMEPFYAESSFLDYAQDMTQFVEYNTINLADAGIDPAVLINNNVWPIPTTQRTDTPIAIPLDTLDTENTLVRNVEEMETAYDKMESVLKGHRRALRASSLKRAAHAYAPNGNTTLTPILEATGAIRADTGRKILLIEDVIKLQRAFDMIEAEGKRVMVLHPYHVEDLLTQDSKAFKEFATLPNGAVRNIYGFTMMKYPHTAVFNGTNVKKSFGSAAVVASDRYSSLAFLEGEVMKADGSVEMFDRLRDPDQRGDIVGFQKRFKALPTRSKFIGSLVSGT